MLIDHNRKHPLTMIIDICLADAWGCNVFLRNCEIYRHVMLNDYDYKEISEAYGLKVPTLWQIVHKANQTLKENHIFYSYLKKYCPDDSQQYLKFNCAFY